MWTACKNEVSDENGKVICRVENKATAIQIAADHNECAKMRRCNGFIGDTPLIANGIAPTPREVAMLKMVEIWQEASRHSEIVLGEPTR